MDLMGKAKKYLALLLTACLLLPLTGCRERTGGRGEGDKTSPAAGAGQSAQAGDAPANGAAAVSSETESAEVTEDGEMGERTQENPQAQRKEYDESASAEVVPGTDRALHGAGAGEGAPRAGEDAPPVSAQVSDRAKETATQTVADQEAEDKGVAEDAEAAESALEYYTVLLEDRLRSVYECHRANVYWETEEDRVTVHKSSPEHALILAAGAYDVAARLLPENVRVDDGWVARKNPQVIVKIVDSGVLGRAVGSAGAARAVYRGLLARDGWAAIDAVREHKVLLLSRDMLEAPYLQTAARLLIARTADPELFSDVDAGEALSTLIEEATGAPAAGIWFFAGWME